MSENNYLKERLDSIETAIKKLSDNIGDDKKIEECDDDFNSWVHHALAQDLEYVKPYTSQKDKMQGISRAHNFFRQIFLECILYWMNYYSKYGHV